MTEVLDVEAGVLATIPEANALAFFTEGNAVDPLLARIKKEVASFKGDVSTASGRKAIASMAHRVARTKTALDAIGKKLVDAQKEVPKKIDATRKAIRDALDVLKDDVRKPLTDWEAAEEARVAAIKTSLAELQGVIDDTSDRPSEQIKERLAEVKREAITEQFYREYAGAAAELKDKAIAALEAQIVRAEKREAEAAELARLRAEAAEREKREREAQIAQRAADAARLEAEAKAAAERKAAEDAERRAREASERRELELKLAAEAAERRALEAETRAKQQAAAEAKRAADEAAAREADKKHKAAVMREACDALIDGGIDQQVAVDVIKLIAGRKIPNVTIYF